MKSLRRYRSRLHRCYELAAVIMTKEPGAERFTLVHGRIKPGFDHAWIDLNDGRIYDPVSNRYALAEEYMKDAVAERRYTQKEFANESAKAEHSGPWHVSPDIEALLSGPEGIDWLADMTGNPPSKPYRRSGRILKRCPISKGKPT